MESVVRLGGRKMREEREIRRERGVWRESGEGIEIEEEKTMERLYFHGQIRPVVRLDLRAKFGFSQASI